MTHQEPTLPGDPREGKWDSEMPEAGGSPPPEDQAGLECELLVLSCHMEGWGTVQGLALS